VAAYRRAGGEDWSLEPDSGRWRWRAVSGVPRSGVGAEIGADWRIEQGNARTELEFLRETEGGGSLREPHAGAPSCARAGLELSRPFFRSDARLTLGGALERRAGLPGRDPVWRLDLSAQVRVLDARFWLRFANVLDYSGEEMPGFPVPPASLRLGMDWHLDH
jgi:hypothetical protein